MRRNLFLVGIIAVLLSSPFCRAAYPSFDSTPRTSVFRFAADRDNPLSDSAQSYILSHYSRFKPFLKMIADAKNDPNRSFAVNLLLKYDIDQYSRYSLISEIYHSEDSVLWQPALDLMIQLTLEHGESNNLSLPFQDGYQTEKRIYFLRRCAPLIDRGVFEYLYWFRHALEDTNPKVAEAAFHALNGVEKHNTELREWILQAVVYPRNDSIDTKLTALFYQLPFLILPDTSGTTADSMGMRTAIDQVINDLREKRNSDSNSYYRPFKASDSTRSNLLERYSFLDSLNVDPWTIAKAVRESNPIIRKSAINAISRQKSYHIDLSSTILIQSCNPEIPQLHVPLRRIIIEKPFLVLPDLILENRFYFKEWDIPIKQYTESLSLSRPQMASILIDILLDTTGITSGCYGGKEQQSLLALAELGEDAVAAIPIVDSLMRCLDPYDYRFPYAVVAMSGINPDYPGLPAIISKGLVGKEAEEKYYRDIHEELQKLIDSGDDTEGFEPQEFIWAYEGKRDLYAKAAHYMGAKGWSIAPAIAITLDKMHRKDTGTKKLLNATLVNFGPAGVSAVDTMIYACSELWNNPEWIKGVVYTMQPDTEIVKGKLLKALTQRSDTSMVTSALDSPMKAVRALGLYDSVLVAAVGDLFTLRGSYLSYYARYTGERYLLEAGNQAKYASNGMTAAFLEPSDNGINTTPIWLGLGSDATSLFANLEAFDGVRYVLSDNDQNRFRRLYLDDDFLDIVTSTGSSAAPYLARLTQSSDPYLAEPAFRGLIALGKNAVEVKDFIYTTYRTKAAWKSGLCWTYLMSLGELAWPVYDEALRHQDMQVRQRAISTLDSLYANSNEYLKDQLRRRLRELKDDPDSIVREVAKEKLEQLEGKKE